MAGYASPAWTNDASPAINATNLLDMSEGIEIAEHPYGVCSTAAATAAKTVTVDFSGTLTLFTGLTVRVKFTNPNTAASPTLNVNSTGAVAMIFGTGNAVDDAWIAGAVAQFTYDGTSWVIDQSEPVNQLIAAAYQRTVNPNILDNAYFVGGGSQQGGGQFPINQRGQTSYTSLSAAYFIDRWKGYGNVNVTVASGGVQIQASANDKPILQNTSELMPGTYTLSVLTSTGLSTKSGTIPTTPSTYTYYIENYDATNHVLLQVYKNGSNQWCVGVSPYNYTSAVTLIAAKLELGSTQTLCHDENGTWVLNEVPDFGEQFVRCISSHADSSDTLSNTEPATRKDLINIDIFGTTNTTGSTIRNGRYFYLNGVLCRAISDIAASATFTLNTNYETLSAGLATDIARRAPYQFSGTYVGNTGKTTFTFPPIGRTGYFIIAANKFFYAGFSGDTANTLTVTDVLTGSAVTATNTSGWTFEIQGMPWYSNPKAIGTNLF